MELCTARTISNLPHHHRLFASNHAPLRWRTSLPLKLQRSFFRTHPGFLHYRSSPVKSTSEGTSREPGVITVEDVPPIEKNSYAETVQNEVAKEDSSMDGQEPALQFLDQLDLKLDSDDTYSIILFGGGALVALWIATVIVGAIDSIPLFPKLLEVVGLGYTLWFTTRYLLFKKNREELVAKIEEIKKQVLGSNDE